MSRISRRGFLGLFGTGVAVAGAELVLPYEPKRIYSFPSVKEHRVVRLGPVSERIYQPFRDSLIASSGYGIVPTHLQRSASLQHLLEAPLFDNMGP